MDDEDTLQMAVKAINDSVGPDGLVPTLLVFGAIPRLVLPTDQPTTSTFKRAVALRKETESMSRHFAKRQVRDALSNRNGPDVSEIYQTPIGSPVLVYRPEKDKWEGPYSLLELRGEDAIVLLPHPSGPTKFRTTVVKPYIVDNRQSHQDVDAGVNDGPAPNVLQSTITDMETPIVSMDISLSGLDVIENPAVWKAVVMQSEDHDFFAAARTNEFNGLVDKGVFALVPESEAVGNRVYNSRFVDEVKHVGTPSAYAKSRLVVQAFNDKEHGLLTNAPTVQRSSQRLLLSLFASSSDCSLFMRDISQAYTQSKSSINRPIYVKPPAILNIPPKTLLRIDRPLYGIPEAGMHWFVTYHAHHLKELSMNAAIHDPCLLYTPKCMSIDRLSLSAHRGVTCLQTDDTLNIGNKTFIDKEEKCSREFLCKKEKTINDGQSLLFNGGTIKIKDDTVKLTQ